MKSKYYESIQDFLVDKGWEWKSELFAFTKTLEEGNVAIIHHKHIVGKSTPTFISFYRNKWGDNT